jgi:hypothetical protein
VDNSDALFVPRPAVPPWSGRPLPASMCQPPIRDADGGGVDRGGFPHPLRDQLDALVYPAWQLEAATPQLPQVQRCASTMCLCHQGSRRVFAGEAFRRLAVKQWQLQATAFALAVAYS